MNISFKPKTNIMKTFKLQLVFTGLFLALALVFTSCGNSADDTNKTQTSTDSTGKEGEDHVHTAYQCPMDCEKGKTYSEPGTCPVCKMDLAKVEVKIDH